MLIGAVMFGGGYISASFATRIWHLYLSQGTLVGLGVGFIYVPSIAVLSSMVREAEKSRQRYQRGRVGNRWLVVLLRHRRHD